jgi:hypothetical protein
MALEASLVSTAGSVSDKWLSASQSGLFKSGVSGGGTGFSLTTTGGVY